MRNTRGATLVGAGHFPPRTSAPPPPPLWKMAYEDICPPSDLKGRIFAPLIKCKMVDICPLLKNKGRTFAPFPPSNKYPCSPKYVQDYGTLYMCILDTIIMNLFMAFTPREQCKGMLALIESIRKDFLLCSNCLTSLNLHNSIPDLFVLPWLIGY